MARTEPGLGLLARRDDGHEVDASRGRLDVARIHQWLSSDAYWALGRSLETVTRSVDESLCFGLYAPSGTQVGFARSVTDRATFAWLCDVYLDRAHRGSGLGTWLVGTAVNHLSGYGLRQVVLATQDAHGVYQRFGFRALDDPERWMRLRPGAG